MVYVAIDKNTHQIGIFDCSDEFLRNGELKVQKAMEIHSLFHKNPDFEPNNYFINETL